MEVSMVSPFLGLDGDYVPERAPGVTQGRRGFPSGVTGLGNQFLPCEGVLSGFRLDQTLELLEILAIRSPIGAASSAEF
jgi:hypothetical protein